MTEAELISIEEISNYLDERQYFQGAYLMAVIRRQGDGPEEPGANTYLGMQVAAPPDRYGERPVVTSAEVFSWPAPAWSADVVGQEPPLGINIEEVGTALGGAGGQIFRENIADEPIGNGEIKASAQDRGETSGKR
jgi:hypothetical protein